MFLDVALKFFFINSYFLFFLPLSLLTRCPDILQSPLPIYFLFFFHFCLRYSIIAPLYHKRICIHRYFAMLHEMFSPSQWKWCAILCLFFVGSSSSGKLIFSPPIRRHTASSVFGFSPNFFFFFKPFLIPYSIVAACKLYGFDCHSSLPSSIFLYSSEFQMFTFCELKREKAKVLKHLWYLTEEVVALAIFDRKLIQL